MNARSWLAPRAWGDRLNPILVKDVRQGLRGTVFTGAYLMLHVLLVGGVGLGLLAFAMSGDRSVGAGLFWTLLSVPLLAVLPAAAAQSLASERGSRAIEPILLTRVDARQLVFGKWKAVALQTLLLVVSALPYLMLRYFTGGLELTRELRWLFDLTACSLVLSALAIAFAALDTPALVRWLATIVTGFAVTPFLVMVLAPPSGLGLRGAASDFTHLVYSTAFVVLLAVSALESAAQHTGPPAESRPAWLRLLALLVLLLLCAASDRGAGAGRDPRPSVLLAAVLLLLCVHAALGACEELPRHSLGLRNWGRARGPRALLALWRAPGWPVAVFVGAVTTLVGGWVCARSFDRPGWPSGVSLAGAMLLPAALVRVSNRPRRRKTLAYVLLQLAAFGPLMVLGLGSGFESKDLQSAGEALLAGSPLSYFLFVLGGGTPTSFVGILPGVTLLSAAACVAAWIAGWRALRTWRQTAARV